MLFHSLILCLLGAIGAYAKDFDFLLSGFDKGASLVKPGPDTICAAGYVSVTITPNNTRILIDEPKNNTRATEILFELIKVDTTIAVTAAGPANRFTSKFRIAARLCYPSALDPDKVKTVQLLTHGFTLSKDYWDFPGDLSHVRAATRAGYATLAYDRLGANDSEQPDPLQVVQLPAHIEVAKTLSERLRAGTLGGRPLRKVVGVGHSLGSIIGVGLTGRYPQVWDAAVHTGFSADLTFVPGSIATIGLEIASTLSVPRWATLSGGYIAAALPYGVQFAWWRWPYYDQSLFDAVFAKRSAGTLGELFTLSFALKPTQFTGPIDIVLGDADYPFCGGNCTSPKAQAPATIPVFYPRAGAGSRSFVLPNAGHNYNAHYGAPAAYEHINEFLKNNGF